MYVKKGRLRALSPFETKKQAIWTKNRYDVNSFLSISHRAYSTNRSKSNSPPSKIPSSYRQGLKTLTNDNARVLTEPKNIYIFPKMRKSENLTKLLSRQMKSPFISKSPNLFKKRTEFYSKLNVLKSINSSKYIKCRQS